MSVPRCLTQHRAIEFTHSTAIAFLHFSRQQGRPVAAISRNRDTLAAAVGITDDDFLPLQADFADEKSVEKAIADTVHKFKSLDVVVNNAGYGIGGAAEELSKAEIDESFAINIFAVLNVVRKAMPLLRAQRSGHIINVSSIAGFAGATGWSVYAAVKSAVIGFSEVLAQDVAALGIKVTVLAPGAFWHQLPDGRLADYCQKPD